MDHVRESKLGYQLFSFSNRVAVVTGVSTRIGASTVAIKTLQTVLVFLRKKLNS